MTVLKNALRAPSEVGWRTWAVLTACSIAVSGYYLGAKLLYARDVIGKSGYLISLILVILVGIVVLAAGVLSLQQGYEDVKTRTLESDDG
jgi:hypothetical protein